MRKQDETRISAPITFLPALGAIALPVVLGIGTAVAGMIWKSGAKKAAKYGAVYAAEKGIDYSSKWAKGKLKGGK